MPKVVKVKNKAPAEIQITAEQLIREAKEHDLEILPPRLKQKISDPYELADYQHRKRKEFENNISKNRMVISNWVKYAQWEESQKQIPRTRSIYERALDVDHRNITLWLTYVEMEMRNRQVNHARNLLDRAVTIFPRVSQFWYKYTYMEEMLENTAAARKIFDHWMEWKPDEQAWQTYINFELRYRELDRARKIYERFVMVHPDVENWVKYARFEASNGFINGARNVYERAVTFYGDEEIDEKLYLAFARFEESQLEHERARRIYKYSIDHIPKERAEEIYKAYTIHEKKYGDSSDIKSVITSKCKNKFEQSVKNDPYNYDTWFDFLKLMESEDNHEETREIYERAVAYVPLKKEKEYWRRYIYLWINYALFEELKTQDLNRCQQVYTACLRLIPHKIFTFAKIWLMYAKFEIRRKNLMVARKTLGRSLGVCPKNKLFRGYIDLEIQLREFDRCRKLYEKWLEYQPENCTTWMKYSELETLLGDIDRARAIYELGLKQPRLDMPELLWKSYIDFEISHKETQNARKLFERLLERSIHVKIWIAYAKFELSNEHEDIDQVEVARRVFERANNELKINGDREDRAILLEAWRAFEMEKGDEESQKKIQYKMPRRIKKTQKVMGEDGAEGWQEVYDFEFPEDETEKTTIKLLSVAKNWKKLVEQTTEER